MAIDPRFRPGWAILQAVLDGPKIVDLARLYFLPFRAKGKVGFLSIDLRPAMATDFRPVEVVCFSVARFLPAPGSICPENFDFGYCLICSGTAPAGFVFVAADFDLCRNRPAIEIAGPVGSAPRRFVADFVFRSAAEAAALVFVWDAVSTVQFSF